MQTHIGLFICLSSRFTVRKRDECASFGFGTSVNVRVKILQNLLQTRLCRIHIWCAVYCARTPETMYVLCTVYAITDVNMVSENCECFVSIEKINRLCKQQRPNRVLLLFESQLNTKLHFSNCHHTSVIHHVTSEASILKNQSIFDYCRQCAEALSRVQVGIADKMNFQK